MLPRVPRLSWVLADRWQDLWNRGAGCQRAVALRLTVFESPRRAVDQPAGVRSCGSADPHVLESDLGDREVAPISMATARRARRASVSTVWAVAESEHPQLRGGTAARFVATLSFNDGSTLLRDPSMKRSTIRCASCSSPRVGPTMVGGTLAASPFPARSGRPR